MNKYREINYMDDGLDDKRVMDRVTGENNLIHHPPESVTHSTHHPHFIHLNWVLTRLLKAGGADDG